MTASGDTALIWDALTGARISTRAMPEHEIVQTFFAAGDGRVMTMARAPDMGEGRRELWSAEDGMVLFQPENGWAVPAAGADGKRFVASGWSQSWIMEGPGHPTAAPAWWGRLAELLGERRMSRLGLLKDIPPAEWLAMREEVRKAVVGDRSRYGETARWLLAEPVARLIHPAARLTRHQVAELFLAPEAGAEEIERAAELNPAHPLLPLRQARLEALERRAAFLWLYWSGAGAAHRRYRRIRAGSRALGSGGRASGAAPWPLRVLAWQLFPELNNAAK